MLKNPVNDANLMAATLQQLGFDVIIKTNADLRTMQMAEVDFKAKLSQYKVALFYFAGHGIQVDGRNYLIPIDAKMDKRELTKYEAFDINNINKAFMANIKNVNIMILDACRDNPFKTWERGGERGFKKIETSSTGTIIAFATQPGATAADGSGGNGLYTSELVKQMAKSQSIEQVFKMTRIEVNRISAGKQIPQDWSSLMANFYFTKTNIELDAEVQKSNNIATASPVFDLPERGTFVDKRDYQEYKWLKIGEQIWMTENMNYKTTDGCWCYDDKSSNCDIYGRLYIWETAKTVCPEGWHLPSDNEWTELTNYLGGESVAGGKMKEVGTEHWKSPNEGASNISGFSGLPGGYRNGSHGSFYGMGYYRYFWSATENNSSYAWGRKLFYKNAEVTRNRNNKSSGFSVRCIKD